MLPHVFRGGVPVTRPTCDQALADARAALEDDERATPGPWSGFPTGILRGPEWVVTNLPRGENSEIMKRADANAIANARTREPRLAEWVRGVLEDNPHGMSVSTVDGARAKLVRLGGVDDEHIKYFTAEDARALAAALLRAADEAEADK